MPSTPNSNMRQAPLHSGPRALSIPASKALWQGLGGDGGWTPPSVGKLRLQPVRANPKCKVGAITRNQVP